MPNQFIATQLSSNARNPSSHASNQNDNAAPINQIEITNVFEEISSYMTLDDINIAATVSKRWNQLFSSPEVWNKAFCERFEISKDSLKSAMLKLEKLPNIKRRLEAKLKLLENSKDQLTHSQFIVTSYKRKLALLMCCADQADEFFSLVSSEEYPFWFKIAVKARSINIMSMLATDRIIANLSRNTLEEALNLLSHPKFNIKGEVNPKLLNLGMNVAAMYVSHMVEFDKFTLFLLAALKANNLALVKTLFAEKYVKSRDGFLKRIKSHFEDESQNSILVLLNSVIEAGNLELLKKFLNLSQFNKAFQKLPVSECIASAILSGSTEMLLFLANKKQLQYTTLQLSREQLETILKNNQIVVLKKVLDPNGEFKMFPQQRGDQATWKHASTLKEMDLTLYILQNYPHEFDIESLKRLLMMNDTKLNDYIYQNIPNFTWTNYDYQEMVKVLKNSGFPILEKRSENVKNALPLITKPIMHSLAANDLALCQSLLKDPLLIDDFELRQALLINATKNKNLEVISFLYERDVRLDPAQFQLIMDAAHFPLFKFYYDNDAFFKIMFLQRQYAVTKVFNQPIYKEFRFQIRLAQYLDQIEVQCYESNEEINARCVIEIMFDLIQGEPTMNHALKKALNAIDWSKENINDYIPKILTIADVKDLKFLLQQNVKFNQSHFEMAVSSSNLVAVEYFLESLHGFDVSKQMLIMAASKLNYPLFESLLSASIASHDDGFEFDIEQIKSAFLLQGKNIHSDAIISLINCYRLSHLVIGDFKQTGLSNLAMEQFKQAYQLSSHLFCKIVETRLNKNEVEAIYHQLEIDAVSVKSHSLRM